jgi:hypothetical protein
MYLAQCGIAAADRMLSLRGYFEVTTCAQKAYLVCMVPLVVHFGAPDLLVTPLLREPGVLVNIFPIDPLAWLGNALHPRRPCTLYLRQSLLAGILHPGHRPLQKRRGGWFV